MKIFSPHIKIPGIVATIYAPTARKVVAGELLGLAASPTESVSSRFSEDSVSQKQKEGQ